MRNKPEKLQDAIFLVTQEKACPIYNIGEEIRVANMGVSISSFKPCCLLLAEKVRDLVSRKEGFGGVPKLATGKTRYDCGGCEGLIHFEYKKEKDYATLQMKLLNEAEERRRKAHLDKFFGVLRSLKIFEPLDDDALVDLTLLLDLKQYPVDKVVIKKGDPSNGLFIMLKGAVAVLDGDGSTIAKLTPGEVFGEMSLLSGDPISNSIHSVEPTYVANLSQKNFRSVIVKYPVLQLFLFKMLVSRAQKMALRAGNITSGMSGEISEISVVDLFQMINSSQKTGVVEFTLNDGRAAVLFKEGQILYARYLEKKNIEAVHALLCVKAGHFSYSKGMPKKFEAAPPIGDFMGILMEGLQKIDEE